MSYSVDLPVFSGPLDLLLHLIEEEEISIYDIPISRITAQYMEYLHRMERLDLHIAGEFLSMAAELLEIKSRMLLPTQGGSGEGEREGEELKMDLARRLEEYKKFREVTSWLAEREEVRSRIFPGALPDVDRFFLRDGDRTALQGVTLGDLARAFRSAIREREEREGRGFVPPVGGDEISVEDMLNEIRNRLERAGPVNAGLSFTSLVSGRSRLEIAVTFFALLELIRKKEVTVSQDGLFSEIMIRAGNRPGR